jgi:hypothetical protein
MKRDAGFPGNADEHEGLLAPLCSAIERGNLDDFEKALAAGGEPGFVNWKVARAIPMGVPPSLAGPGNPTEDCLADEEFLAVVRLNDSVSIAELCFHYDQPEMLRVAANSVWPEMPDDTIRTPADRMETLSTRHAHDALARINLAHYAAFWKKAQSVEFIALALELGQDAPSLDILSDSDPEAAALIREARMQLTISRKAPAEPAAPQGAPAARARSRHV